MVRGQRTSKTEGEIKMGKIQECPRCGDKTYEKLADYAHCFNCLYYEDHWVGPDHQLVKAMQEINEIEPEEIEQECEGDAEIQDCA